MGTYKEMIEKSFSLLISLEVIELNDNDVVHDNICIMCNVFLGMS